jgi:adenylate cyclase
MGIEIERKFLLRDDTWRAGVARTLHLRQGYVIDAAALTSGLARASVRVRVQDAHAWLNIKAARSGIARDEYDYAIPRTDAEHMLETLCNGLVEKQRHVVPVAGVHFEIDEFLGSNAGLIVAELELPAADAPFPRPPWLGREVSEYLRYFNVNLIAHPYCAWSAAERAGDEAC